MTFGLLGRNDYTSKYVHDLGLLTASAGNVCKTVLYTLLGWYGY